MPVFITGMTAYYLLPTARDLHRGFRFFAAIGFVTLTALSVALWSFGGLSFALIPAISGLAFVCLLAWLKDSKHQSKILCRVGKVSFSMYVFHFVFAIYIVPKVLKIYLGSLNPDLLLALAFTIVSVLTYLVARFTEGAIEARGIRLGSQIIAKSKTPNAMASL